MSELLMSYKDLRNSIELKESGWNNLRSTNCYAFALGLDIPSGKLMPFGLEYPYNVGVIGGQKYELDYFDLLGLSLEERLQIDLDALGIKYEESSQYDIPVSDEHNLNWLIAMYKQKDSSDFHFLRKSSSNYWLHKIGTHGSISNRDSKNYLITDLDKATFIYDFGDEVINYNLEKVYKLSLHR